MGLELLELIKRHPLLFGLLSLFLIALPQAIQSWLSLWERATGMNIIWSIWLPTLVSLILLLIVIYRLRERKKGISIAGGAFVNPISPSTSGMPRTDFDNRKLYIGELFRDEHTKANASFRNCEIIGPGLLGFDSQTRLDHCTFYYGNKIDDMLVVISETRMITGGVEFINCVFQNCAFKRIGFLVNPETARVMRGQLANQ